MFRKLLKNSPCISPTVLQEYSQTVLLKFGVPIHVERANSCLISTHCRVAIPALVVLSSAGSVLGSLGVHKKGNNETVKTQNFSENEDQNHADKQTRLLSCATNTSVTDNTNGETSSETSETDSETSTELDETCVKRELLLQTIGDKNRHDQTVNTNDTGHNDGNNVLHDEVRAEDTHGGDTDPRLGGTVRGTQAGEDDSAGAAHGTKEGRIDRAGFGELHLEGCRAFDGSIMEKSASLARALAFDSCGCRGRLGDG